MQVNDLIFKELIRRGYSLRGNTRVWDISDSKLWYLTPEQAQAYLDLEFSENYKEAATSEEMRLIENFAPKIVDEVLNGSNVNIIDIGCGNGVKSIKIIDEVCKEVKMKYCPIDISSYMVKQAIKNISDLKKGEVIEFSWNISDFENLENISSLLRDKEYRQNLFLFLGGTVGNFELHEVMHEIAEAVGKAEDYLLVDFGLKGDDEKEMAQKFKSKELDDFFGLILTQLGFSKDEIEFDVRYANSRVEVYYTLKCDKTVKLDSRTLDFKNGDQVLVAVGYRYKKEEFEEALKLYFSDVKSYIEENGTRALVLCKK